MENITMKAIENFDSIVMTLEKPAYPRAAWQLKTILLSGLLGRSLIDGEPVNKISAQYAKRTMAKYHDILKETTSTDPVNLTPVENMSAEQLAKLIDELSPEKIDELVNQ